MMNIGWEMEGELNISEKVKESYVTLKYHFLKLMVA